MIKHIFDNKTLKFIRTEEAEPECGEDFCDSCGDCLVCYGDDPCYGSDPPKPEHYWVEYLDHEQKDSEGKEGE